MAGYALSDATWQRLAPLLPGRAGTPERSGDDNRRFLDAVVWLARNSGPWRDLPAALGHWNSVWRRFDHWAKRGIGARLFEQSQDPDLEWLLLDSTSVRALYRERNAIEPFFGRLKHDRRAATRYEKTAPNSLAFLQSASTLTLLR